MKPLRILIVDDEIIMLDLLNYILMANGHKVNRASDGDKALEMIEDKAFDLIITDLEMGQTSGLEVVARAKSLQRATAVFMLTGCCSTGPALAAYRLGADAYLHKPFDLHDLLSRVELVAQQVHRPVDSGMNRQQSCLEEVLSE